jgi:hypothetical protein
MGSPVDGLRREEDWGRGKGRGVNARELATLSLLSSLPFSFQVPSLLSQPLSLLLLSFTKEPQLGLSAKEAYCGHVIIMFPYLINCSMKSLSLLDERMTTSPLIVSAICAYIGLHRIASKRFNSRLVFKLNQQIKTNTTSNGAIARTNQKLTMEARTITLKKFRHRVTAQVICCGSNSSTQPMSLENRFIIRPTGFLSINNTADLIIANVIPLWRFSEDRRIEKKRTNVLVTDII